MPNKWKRHTQILMSFTEHIKKLFYLQLHISQLSNSQLLQNSEQSEIQSYFPHGKILVFF